MLLDLIPELDRQTELRRARSRKVTLAVVRAVLLACLATGTCMWMGGWQALAVVSAVLLLVPGGER